MSETPLPDGSQMARQGVPSAAAPSRYVLRALVVAKDQDTLLGMDPSNKTITINFDAIAEIGRVGVRRAAAFLALGHKAWSDEALSSVVVPVPMGLRFLPDPLRQADRAVADRPHRQLQDGHESAQQI